MWLVSRVCRENASLERSCRLIRVENFFFFLDTSLKPKAFRISCFLLCWWGGAIKLQLGSRKLDSRIQCQRIQHLNTHRRLRIVNRLRSFVCLLIFYDIFLNSCCCTRANGIWKWSAMEPVPKTFKFPCCASNDIERKDSPDNSASVRAVWWAPWTTAMFTDKFRLIFVHVVRRCLVVVRTSFSASRIESLFNWKIAVWCVGVIGFRIRIIAIICLLLLLLLEQLLLLKFHLVCFPNVGPNTLRFTFLLFLIPCYR